MDNSDDNSEDNNEIDFDKFINDIFNSPPKKINSVVLSLTSLESNELFDRLINIFTEASVILFGDSDNNVAFKNLSSVDINRINDYFNSFGIKVFIKSCHLALVNNLKRFINNEDPIPITKQEEIEITTDYPYKPKVIDIIDHNNLRSNKLKDYRYQIIEDNIYIIVSFDILNTNK